MSDHQFQNPNDDHARLKLSSAKLELDEIVQEQNTFYMQQIYDLEKLINKMSEEVKFSIERECKLKKQYELLEHEFSLKQEDFNEVVKHHLEKIEEVEKRNMQLESERETSSSERADLLENGHSNKHKKTKKKNLQVKTDKGDKYDYIVKLESKCEMLNKKLQGFLSKESNYHIDMEKYRQMIEHEYKNEIQEMRLTIQT